MHKVSRFLLILPIVIQVMSLMGLVGGVFSMDKNSFKVLGNSSNVKICKDFDFELIEIEEIPVTETADENFCGKYYGIKDSKEYFFYIFGVLIYKHKISDNDFSKFREFHVKTVFKENNPAIELKVIRFEEVRDPLYSVEKLYIADKNLPKPEDQWVYEMAIRNDGPHSILIFTMMPRSVTPEFIHSLQTPEAAELFGDTRDDVMTWYRGTKELLAPK
jgi:hypothetical protein